VLVDSSRHYQPIAVIQTMIDAMAMSKLNVLHW
jgi:hexosaminidase